jgi:hypothetical protein
MSSGITPSSSKAAAMLLAVLDHTSSRSVVENRSKSNTDEAHVVDEMVFKQLGLTMRPFAQLLCYLLPNPAAQVFVQDTQRLSRVQSNPKQQVLVHQHCARQLLQKRNTRGAMSATTAVEAGAEETNLYVQHTAASIHTSAPPPTTLIIQLHTHAAPLAQPLLCSQVCPAAARHCGPHPDCCWRPLGASKHPQHVTGMEGSP